MCIVRRPYVANGSSFYVGQHCVFFKYHMDILYMHILAWTDIGHAHNEDNDEDKKNFNKLNTKFYTIVVTH